MAAEWRQKAERGDPEAMFKLGRSYLNGKDGVAEDNAQAVAWFRKAADQGHADAMFKLGACYRHGYGVPQDGAQAATWYHKAIAAGATTGLPEANLGDLYKYGWGVPASLPDAFKWYRAGAAKGNQFSEISIARLKRENPNEWPGWERDRLAAEQREKDPRAKAEHERRAAEQKERERLAAQQREAAERERMAAQQRERDRLAAEKAEQERHAAEQKERERREAEQREDAERERVTGQQRERERVAAQQREAAERERVATQHREAAERERVAAQQRDAAERQRVVAQRVSSCQPSEWRVDDLAAWLEQVGLTSLVSIFRQQEIDGDSIAELTDERLKEIGVSAFGARTKFLKQRDQLLAERGGLPPARVATQRAAEGQASVSPAAETASNLPAAKALQVVLERMEVRQETPSTASVTAEIEAGVRKAQEALQHQLEVTTARHSNEWATATRQLEEAHRQFAEQLSRLQTDTERAHHMASLVKAEFATFVPILKKIEQKEKSRTDIMASPFHQQYYRAYMEVLNATYQAAMVIHSGYVDLNANNTASTFGGALADVGSAVSNVPVAGQVISIAMIATAYLFKKVGERQRRMELGRITSHFPNPAAWFDKVEEAAASITVAVRWNAIAALKPAAAQSSSWFSGVTGFFKEVAGLFRGSSANPLSVWQLAAVSDATAALESLMSESSDATEYTLVDRLKTVAASHVWPASLVTFRPVSNQIRVGVQLEGRPGNAAVWVPVPESLDALLTEASSRLKQSVVALRDAKLNVRVLDVNDLRDRDVLIASTAKQEEDRQRLNKPASKLASGYNL